MRSRDSGAPGELQPSRIVLLSILTLAVVLRFWALGHGIPFALGVDEPEVLERAVGMMKSGSLHPRFFDYPALYIYVQMVTACLRFMAGAVTGLWASLAQAGPEQFYLWGRAVTALFGAGTVWLVYRLGLRWGPRHALLAAGLLAVLPLHVRQSHYVLTDVPLAFFVSVVMLLSLRAHDLGTVSAFAWAGIATGVATATKYNGALALVMPLMACVTTGSARVPRALLAVAAVTGCVIAFIAGAPYSLLDLPAFLNGFAGLSSQYRNLPPLAEPGWSIYVKHLRLVLGWPAFVMLAAGLALGLGRMVRPATRIQWALATVFPVLYFAFVSDQRIVYARYLLPVAPAVCLLIAAAVIAAGDALRPYGVPRRARTAAVLLLTVAVLLPPTVQSIQFDRMIGRRSTVELAYEWIQENVPAGSRIAIETRGLLLPPAYRSHNFPRLILDHATRATRDYETYRSEGYDYLIASSQAYGPVFDAPQRAFEDYAAYRRLFDQSIELTRFTPNREHPGPELRVFRLQAAGASSPPRSDH